MQRFSAWVRKIALGVLTLFVLPIAVEFLKHIAEKVGLYDRPGDAVDTILNFFLSLAELPWLRITALALGAFVAGLWLDWLLRKLDDTRADERKVLGNDMIVLADNLEELTFPMQQGKPSITSCFASARKLGIWAPDDRVFLDLPSDRATDLIVNYLRQVGTMLKDGHFRKAKQDAKKSKADFNKAYAQHPTRPDDG
jgi:hypothetical protein